MWRVETSPCGLAENRSLVDADRIALL